MGTMCRLQSTLAEARTAPRKVTQNETISAAVREAGAATKGKLRFLAQISARAAQVMGRSDVCVTCSDSGVEKST